MDFKELFLCMPLSCLGFPVISFICVWAELSFRLSIYLIINFFLVSYFDSIDLTESFFYLFLHLKQSETKRYSCPWLKNVSWSVLILPLMSTPSILLFRFFEDVQNAHILSGITITFMFYKFSSSLATAKSKAWQVFWVTMVRWDLLTGTVDSICISKSREICLIRLLSLLLYPKFFTPALVDGLSLESESQQVSLSLNDFSQYSGWFFAML